MFSTIVMLAALIGAVAAVCATQFLVLAFRDPHRHALLRTSFAESAAVIGLLMALVFSISLFISTLVGAGLNILAAMLIGIAVPVIVAFANDRMFRVRARLRRADSGQSPFAPLEVAVENPSEVRT